MHKQRDCDALLLDFGGVVTPSLFETSGDIERTYELPAGTLNWRGPFDPTNDPLWLASQCGEISEREYWYKRAEELSSLVGQSLTIQSILRDTRASNFPDGLRSEALSTITDAQEAGIPVGLLSNEMELFYGAEALSKIPFLANLSCIVDGTHTNVLKPEPEAFFMATQQLGTLPSRVVFVDDQEKNIAGAKRSGLKAIHFDITNPTQSFNEVRKTLSI